MDKPTPTQHQSHSENPQAAFPRAFVEMRLARESLSSVAAAIGRAAGGREAALAKTKIEEAEMWLRKAGLLVGADLPPEQG